MRIKILFLVVTLIMLSSNVNSSIFSNVHLFVNELWGDRDYKSLEYFYDAEGPSNDLGKPVFNLVTNTAKKCNGKGTRFSLYRGDSCSNLSSEDQADYTFQQISKIGDLPAYKITMKNGDKNSEGIPSSVELTFICDQTHFLNLMDVIEPLTYLASTNVYSSVTKSPLACTEAKNNEFFKTTNDRQLLYAVFMIVFAMLLVFRGKKVYYLVVLHISIILICGLLQRIKLIQFQNYYRELDIMLLTSFFAVFLGVLFSFGSFKVNQYIPGVSGVLAGLLIGLLFTVIGSYFVFQILYVGLGCTAVFMLVGYKLALNFQNICYIFSLNFCASLFTFIGFYLLFTMPIGTTVIMLTDKPDYVFNEVIGGTVLSLIISLITFVLGCGLHWYFVTIEKEIVEEKEVLVIAVDEINE